MANFNKVILIGNLTRDPELRYTPKGTAVAKLAMAVNRSWRTESGETREETTFVDIDAFGKQAEVIGQYLKKGRPLMVEGRLKLDQWDDKNTGQKRSRLGVVLENFQFLDGGGGGGGRGREASNAGGYESTGGRQASEPATPYYEEGDSNPTEEDDVPF